MHSLPLRCVRDQGFHRTSYIFQLLLDRLHSCIWYRGDDDGIGTTAVVRNGAQVISHAAMLLLLLQ